MIVRITLIKKLEGMSTSAFEKHWREVHVPLATQLEGLSLYHLNQVRSIAPPDSRLLTFWPFDGIAQLGFESLESMKRAGSTAAGKADRANFIQEQHTLVCRRVGEAPDPKTEAVKCMIFMQRDPRLSAAQCWTQLLDGRGDGIENLPGFVARVDNLVIARWLEPWMDALYESLPVDAVEELWFTDAQSLRHALSAMQTQIVRGIRSRYVKDQAFIELESFRAIA